MGRQFKIKSKLPSVGQSIFTEMTRYALAHNAINLAQGFPNFSSSTKLFDLVNKYMYADKNQYAPMSGLPALKEAIKEKYQKVYSEPLNSNSQIAITAGATQAIFTTFQSLLHTGDEVIYFEPAYDAYAPGIQMAGATGIPIICHYPNFEIDWNLLASTISDNTRMIVVNNPGNPSGRIWTRNDFEKLYSIIKDREIFVLSDEVYEHLTYDGKRHLSILQIPEFKDRSIAVYSFGKTFHNTGWKIGYIICQDNIYQEFLKVHQFNVFSVHSPSQYAFADYIREEENYSQLSKFYQEKRDQFLQGITQSRFKVIPTSSTYFQLLDYSNISQEDDISFAKRITKEFGVASIPMSTLYSQATNQQLIRFCFAKQEQTLKEATKRLCKI